MRLRTPRAGWLLSVVIAAGLGASLFTSYTLYRSANRSWLVRAETDAQRLSGMLVGWIDDSNRLLSGLSALVENSKKVESDEFLNAFESMESRATTGFLHAAAMLEQRAPGTWALTVSSGDFELLERDAASGFASLRPTIELALARPDQYVLGPVERGRAGTAISPVAIAPRRVRTPTVLIGKLDYATIEGALRAAPTPKGFYLTLRGKFLGSPESR